MTLPLPFTIVAAAGPRRAYQLFRQKDEHERGIPNRWSAVRIECAQAGTPNNRPLAEDSKKRRKTSSKKVHLKSWIINVVSAYLARISGWGCAWFLCPKRTFIDEQE